MLCSFCPDAKINNTIYIFAWGNNPKRAKLKGRACKIIAHGAMNSCEVIFTDTLQREIVSRRALRTIPCRSCGRPLIESDFNSGYAVRTCNHFDCPLYAQPQGYRARSEKEGLAFNQRKSARMALRFTDGNGNRPKANPENKAANDRRKLRPGYQPWLKRKKDNYHRLRKLGYNCTEATFYSSDKRMRELGLESKEKVPKEKEG